MIKRRGQERSPQRWWQVNPEKSYRPPKHCRSHWKVLVEDGMVRPMSFEMIAQLLCEGRLRATEQE